MKILQVVHSFLPQAFAGVEIHVYNLARILREKHEVHVLHRVDDRGATDFETSYGEYGGVPVVQLVNNQTGTKPVELELSEGVRRSFAAVLDRLEPDVVHFHHLSHLSIDLVDEVKGRGIPAICTLHDFWHICCRVQLYIPGKGRCSGPTVFKCSDCFDRQEALIRSMGRFHFLTRGAAGAWMNACPHVEWPGFMKRMGRRLERMRDALNAYDLIIANSEHTKRRHVRFGAPEKRIVVLRYGLDRARLAAARHAPSVDVRFGFLGSIVEHKGLEVLLDAFRRVPEAPLKVWGNPEQNEAVRKYRATLNPSENVRFMGGFTQQDIAVVLQEIDVLIVPSIWEEAYGLTMDEAKVAGIPVVASRIGGLPEHLVQGKEGYLFAPGDARELEGIVRRLAGRPDRVEALRPTGDDVLSLHENARDVETIYERIS